MRKTVCSYVEQRNKFWFVKTKIMTFIKDNKCLMWKEMKLPTLGSKSRRHTWRLLSRRRQCLNCCKFIVWKRDLWELQKYDRSILTCSSLACSKVFQRSCSLVLGKDLFLSAGGKAASSPNGKWNFVHSDRTKCL